MMLPNFRHISRLAKVCAAFMILCHRLSFQGADPAPVNNIAVNGAFITLHGYAVKGPMLGSHICRSMLQCCHLCLKNSKCVSYNYEVSNARNGKCEISEESIQSKEERDARLERMPGFVFVQITRKDLVNHTLFSQLR